MATSSSNGGLAPAGERPNSRRNPRGLSRLLGCFSSRHRDDRDRHDVYAPTQKAETREASVQAEIEAQPEAPPVLDVSASGGVDKVDASATYNVHVHPPPSPLLAPGNITDALFRYKKKPENGPTGHGLLVIVAMFTQDLKGYIADMSRLKSFFSDELGYDVEEKVNCSRSGLFDFIKHVQKRLKDTPSYDRLVFAILTHGLQGGLQTCANSFGFDMEQDSHGRDLLTPVDEIVACFKHDNAPTLKNLPKLFLIQACRGTTIVKAAGGRNSLRFMKPMFESDLSIRLQTTVPVDADILVVYASTEEHYSFVHPTKGSWLIDIAMEVFTKHYKKLDVDQMVTIVINAIPELRMTVLFPGEDKGNAVQIPLKVSTLRRQFFFHSND